MDKVHKKWLTYWKKSLSDSMKADIDIEKLPHFEIDGFDMQSQQVGGLEKANSIIDLREAQINKSNGISRKDSKNWAVINEVQVVISPLKLKPTPENLIFLKDKKPKFPFWYFANLDRQGQLQISGDIFPIFQRKYLDPLADERTEFIFGSVENVDIATSLGKENYADYQEYIDYLGHVFKKAIGQEINSYSKEGYETAYTGIVLLPDADINAAVSIIQLYEKLLKREKLPELLKAFITLKNSHEMPPVSVPQLSDLNSLHLGQMGSDFPLSVSQRKSLYTFLQAKDKVFAVNGPPGTGKTTLLQSIVANRIVESALNGSDAPIILACSTNNQAVTNIIDSFSNSKTASGKLQGRWLPEIKGYATYLPANSKDSSELKDINFKKQSGEGLFGNIENYDFLRGAKQYFQEKAASYFGKTAISISAATSNLRNEIIEIQSVLRESSLRWNDYVKAEKLFLDSYPIENGAGSKYYQDALLSESYLNRDIESLEKIEEKIIVYFNSEPFFRKLFCFFGLKSALRNRASEIKIILRNSLIEKEIGDDFKKSAILEKAHATIKLAKIIIISIGNWKSWKKKHRVSGNPPREEKEYWDFELLKIEKGSGPNCFYDELDITFRHKAFQLALHYWEGEYLAKLEYDLADPNFDRKGEDSMINRWRRQSMLTPCFVSTFYMAPKFFSSFRFLKRAEDGSNIFDNMPLYNFIDLLIVDEAGQVSPEVGTATFALAKQALIVGDVKQIEPVWNVTGKIDVGNLKKCELITSYDDMVYEKEFDPKGFLCSTGSIMKMAQNACNFKQSGQAEKGVMLVEHRRCYDEIINYCNVLAYNGQLIPLKGKAKDLLFPPMYCIHVEGNSVTSNSSRYNQSEVNSIVDWLSINKGIIEKKYGRLEEAVGIITPFVGQKNSLRYALKNAGFDVSLIKLGTVHALQGAERPIVLFSMVYGKGDSGTMFFDRDNKPNMLNVAVSRAKDNFIVFANTEILNKKVRTPSGILANHLTFEKMI